VGGILCARAADFSFGGFGQKKPEGKAPFGGENPYRVFGVTEDAPYEEVEMAYKELCEENAGDDKYLIKLEMMKEKIFDDRLKARMSGALKSKVRDSPFEKKLQVHICVLSCIFPRTWLTLHWIRSGKNRGGPRWLG
jgi:hypothetical protein